MRDEILALLEEEPQDHIQLAKTLGKPRELVRQELRHLAGLAIVHRKDGCWHLTQQAASRPVLPASWWITAPRDGFTSQCLGEHGRMKQSKHSRPTAPGVVEA